MTSTSRRVRAKGRASDPPTPSMTAPMRSDARGARGSGDSAPPKVSAPPACSRRCACLTTRGRSRNGAAPAVCTGCGVAQPEVIATWPATPPALRTLQRDPLVRAWINFGAARRAWLDEHGYTLRTTPPGMGSGAPHWARPGELPDTLRSGRSRNREV